MVLEAQQIERVEAENRAGPAGAREWMAVRRDALIDRLREVLEATAFSNLFLLPPRRLPQIAQAEANAFLDFLKTGDADRIREQGVKRAEEGLGEQAMLRLGTTLRQFCRDERADEALRAADVYTNVLLEGFMEGREAIVLREQEQIRRALQKVANKRALQLATAAEVSRAASSILDTDELLAEIVYLICDRFDLYYVGIFLVDETGKYVLLRAGTGEAGLQMLKAGHKFKIGGTSMVGWCAANAKARIALDVGREAVRFDNPLLPETRSEMALPLISRGWVIGVMTIQSTKPDAFSEEDISVLQTMADQLANAIENAHLFEETLARTREVTTLAETGRKLASTLGLDAVLDFIMDACLELFQVQQACFIMMDKDGYLRMRRHRGLSEEFVRSIVGRPGEGFFGKVYQSGEAILVRDAREQIDPATAEAVLREGITSFVHVPVRVKGGTVAVLNVTSSREDLRFSERDLEKLSAFANQAAIAIENARLFEAEAQRRREAETLRQAATALTSTLDLEKALDLILEQLHRVVAYDSASVHLLQDNHLEIVGGRGFADPSAIIGLRFPVPGDNPNTRVIESGEPVILADAQAAHAPFREPPHDHIRSWLGVPMRFRERTTGMIALDSTELGHFTADHARLATAFASQAAMVVENARLFQETQIRAKELAVLNEMGRALTTMLDVDAVIESLYQHASRLIDTTNFYVALYHPEQDEVSFPLYAEGGPIRRPERRRSGKGLTEYVIQTREPLLIEENLIKWLEELGIEMIGQEAQSWLGVPMIIGEQVIGVIAVQSYTTPRLYNERHRDLLSAIANQAAIAIENARLFEQAQARARREQILREITARVRGSTDPDAIMRTAVRELGTALGRPTLVRLVSAEQLSPTSVRQADGDDGQGTAQQGQRPQFFEGGE